MSLYRVFISILCMGFLCNVYADTTYAKRFEQYLVWHKQLPLVPTPEFITFISGSKPLAVKLRNQWLYELARQKRWDLYTKYYKPTQDVHLQCYQNVALLAHGNFKQVAINAEKLWLNPQAQPKVCDPVFQVLLKDNIRRNQLLLKRMKLAIVNGNVKLSYYLMRQLMHNKADIIVLNKLQQRVMTDPDKTLKPYKAHGVQKNLYKYLKENFYIQVFLYKAKHQDKASLLWFNKIDPAFYTDDILAWKIKTALRISSWDEVIKTIAKLKDKNLPEWQYWLARAEEAKGKKEIAFGIYRRLIKNRDYYGFLSGYRLKEPYNFNNEHKIVNLRVLSSYNNIMHKIAGLYNNKDITEASGLANDFFSELPVSEKIAFCMWLSDRLHWYGKSVELSRDPLLANQLFLRFPVVYYNLVNKYGKKYDLPNALIYAVIRQESAFRERVLSFAGAQGLMQLMPATAAFIAKKAGISYRNQKQLLEQDKNINLGAAYLHLLASKFNRNLVLMAASYNAGPTQVTRWLRLSNNLPLDIWIELIPWQETRNYLKNVIMFYAIYQYRLQQRPDISGFFKVKY